MQISDKTFLTVISLLVLIAILSTAYIFLIRKDYDFVIEAPCDAAKERCFYRDCSIEECPPNGLEHYRIFTVSAADYSHCSDETCLAECTNNVITCGETLCGESEEDECAEQE